MRRLFPSLLLLLLAGPVLASPQQAIAASLADARKLGKDAAYRTRYMTLDNLPEAEREEMLAVLDGWIPHVSREADIVRPRRVNADVIAVVLDDYGWSEKTWESMRFEPYFHAWDDPGDGYVYYRTPALLDGRQIDELKQLTASKVPLVRADFWLFYSSRQLDLRNQNNHGFGYLDWLQLKNRKDVEKLASLDRKKSIALGKELRAILEQGASGVVQLDRQIEWYATYGDGDFGAWITLDTFDNYHNTAPGNLQRGTFKDQAQEWVFGLPSGAVGMWLEDGKGGKQDSVPDKLGGQDTPLRIGRDTRAHVGLCFHCHRDGFLQDIDDWARRTFVAPAQLDETDYRRFQQLRRQYFGNLSGQIARGRARYSAMLRESCGLTSEQFAKGHAKAFYRYQYGVRDAATLAVELGTTERQLLRSLNLAFAKTNAKLSVKERQRLAPLLPLIAKEPRPLPITYVEQFFQAVACIVRDYP